jgi:hypothetical protein
MKRHCRTSSWRECCCTLSGIWPHDGEFVAAYLRFAPVHGRRSDRQQGVCERGIHEYEGPIRSETPGRRETDAGQRQVCSRGVVEPARPAGPGVKTRTASQPPFPGPPVRPNGSFRGLPQKANSCSQPFEAPWRMKPSSLKFHDVVAWGLRALAEPGHSWGAD